MEDEIGSLEVGKRADLIVVATDRPHQQPQDPAANPYSFLVYSTKASDVRTVIVEGTVVVEDGRVLTLDAAEVLEKATYFRTLLTGQ
jgi:5-methylthioadenosine/S-adenosylhomocysteine deaminase